MIRSACLGALLSLFAVHGVLAQDAPSPKPEAQPEAATGAPSAGGGAPQAAELPGKAGQQPADTVVAPAGVIPGAVVGAKPGGGGGGAAGAAASGAEESPHNDYPTVTRADYVFACMQVNGTNRDILQKCSCSIDTIATILPFAKYEEAETVMSIVQRGGDNVAAFHSPLLTEKVNELKRAQVEAELRCF